MPVTRKATHLLVFNTGCLIPFEDLADADAYAEGLVTQTGDVTYDRVFIVQATEVTDL